MYVFIRRMSHLRMRLVSLVLFGLVGTAHGDPAPRQLIDPTGHPAPPGKPAPPPRFASLIDAAKALLVVGACADGAVPANVKQATVDAHCKLIKATQADYKKSWLAVASPFFAANVPATVPKTVVYPFAGGDLSTALTVYPDADDITTLSLEPAGDATSLSRLSDKQLKKELRTVEKELASLYTSNYSVTMNMVDAMIVGELPTQLIFSLSALWIHGYEPVSMRYFTVNSDGTLAYLTDDDLAVEKIEDSIKRNQRMANVEIRFRKVGTKKQQTYRHIMANLDDKHLKSTPGVLKYLETKGTIAAMTKAASYLLSFDEFSAMRKYLVDHVVWMVSDSTGLAPSYGKSEGFEYETWGQFDKSNMRAGRNITPSWSAEYAAQPKRELKFRFGYPDSGNHGHLIIMRKTKKP